MSDSSNGGGVSSVGLLQVMFIGLKLGGIIGWSWWWVMSPTWITTGIVVTLAVILLSLKK